MSKKRIWKKFGECMKLRSRMLLLQVPIMREDSPIKAMEITVAEDQRGTSSQKEWEAQIMMIKEGYKMKIWEINPENGKKYKDSSGNIWVVEADDSRPFNWDLKNKDNDNEYITVSLLLSSILRLNFEEI